MNARLAALSLSIGLFLAGVLCLDYGRSQTLPLLGAGKGAVSAPPSGFNLIASGFGDGNFGTPNTVTLDTTGANLIVVFVTQYDGYTIGSVTDNKGNGSPTGLTAQDSAVGSYGRIYYWVAPTVGSSHIFSFGNGSVMNGWIAVQAWSGANASPFDQESGAVAINVATIQPGSLTPAQNNSLVIAGLSANTGTTFAIDSGLTITSNVDSGHGSSQGSAMAYIVQGTAGAVNPTWSWAGGTASPATVLATFKP